MRWLHHSHPSNQGRVGTSSQPKSPEKMIVVTSQSHPVAVKKSPGTPLFNAQKATTTRKNAPLKVAITAAEVRKLSPNDPGRLAYNQGGPDGYARWAQSANIQHA